MSFFSVVDQHVARNPVARAVQKRRIEAAIRDYQTALYLAADGSDQVANASAGATVIAVALRLVGDTGPGANVMRGALSALLQSAVPGARWRAINAGAVDVGMSRAASVILSSPAEVTREAWKYVSSLEAA